MESSVVDEGNAGVDSGRMTASGRASDVVWSQRHVVAAVVGAVVSLMGGTSRPRRDERGLSQSTENAILLAGAAAIALTIITVITAYVKHRLPK